MSIKQYYILTLLGLFHFVVASGQQLPQFTQYMYNTMSVNPAYTGSRGTLNATLLYRYQWAGIEGNPRTATLAVHSPMKYNRSALGISYINDRSGDEQSHFAFANYSYTIPMGQKLKLALGLNAGLVNYGFKRIPDPTDPSFSGDFTRSAPNFGAGLYLHTNHWYLGVSTPRILTTDLNEGEFEALERNSYYGIAGVVINISPTIKFKPTALAKITNGAPASYDATASLLFSEKLWIGASYRFNDVDNIGFLLDYQVTDFIRLGYAYDLPRGDFNTYSSGSHEIILIYELWPKKLGGIKSPRYF
ncbi:MAG: type IX secretion system membrane protein PorP/SprF [Flavobacteriaceae bacterium]